MSLVCLSSANYLRAFLCIIFRRGFLLGRQPCRTIWCSVRRMVWALTGWPPHTPLQPLQQCWQHSCVYFPNTTSGYDAEHVPSTSLGRSWRGLFWVEPVLLIRCMILTTMLQLSFRAIVLQPTSSLCRATTLFSHHQRVVCHEVPCWTSSDQYERVRAITPNLTHLLPIHTWDLATLTSHMTPGRENG